ncbi:FeoB-associated Cys-rich membrane protein [Sedimentibacter sp. zth1]|uniref:FeoB-associated Cys-rich membrane protein n=1 Tax=Sedimentibacter sp. zth1 TaxID=2816908 RepID=UPI001A91ABBA|nr:FeoB-associated Cys-rich membrane protein [Sedimentibacter sp. zth1]QSX06924.1 FeoB-associated Cys-rich membrane protein [Sedimentibacter sp. zth1]
MFAWIISNIATIIISIVLLTIIATIINNLTKNMKKGKSLCGCNCSTCPMSASCHTKVK